MHVTILKSALMTCFLIGGALIPASCGLAEDTSSAPEEDPQGWVEKRIEEIQPTAEEKRFDEIGWTRNLLDAEKLALEHQRPIFLFTHDGKMNAGRC